jgi:uncharacterized protein (UPF0333 family)
MLKVTLRLLVILLVIALIGAGIYALVQNSPTNSGNPAARGFPGQTVSVASRSSTGQAFSPQRFGERGEGRFNFSLGRGLAGALGNSLEILAITLTVILIRKAIAPRRFQVRTVRINQPS